MRLIEYSNKKGAFIMTRIKMNDLPKDMKINKQEMKRVLGGIDTSPTLEKVYTITALPWEDQGPVLRPRIETVPLPE